MISWWPGFPAINFSGASDESVLIHVEDINITGGFFEERLHG